MCNIISNTFYISLMSKVFIKAILIIKTEISVRVVYVFAIVNNSLVSYNT